MARVYSQLRDKHTNFDKKAVRGDPVIAGKQNLCSMERLNN